MPFDGLIYLNQLHDRPGREVIGFALVIPGDVA